MKKKLPIHADLKAYIDYIKPYVDLALTGKVNGHNMHRGYYEVMKGIDIPIVFNDTVYSILSVIANATSGYRKSDKLKLALNFIYEDKPFFEAGSLSNDEIGLACTLFYCLKTIEAYIHKGVD